MKLLIVEDSEFVRNTIITLLANYMPHLKYLEATDGLQGLEKLKSDNPNIILTDLLMPNMTGREFIHKIRDMHSTIPIIVFSADVQDSIREELFKLGIIDFINKPMDQKKAKKITNIIKGLIL